MSDAEGVDKSLQVRQGVAGPASINPDAARQAAARGRGLLAPETYVEGILAGDRVVLSRTITLIESTRADHQAVGQAVLERCLPHTGGAVRVGITGVPGVGKSTFIDALGMHLIDGGHRLAVLAIDPSSARTKGSILGDKTRMERLAASPQAFIRPSPAGGSLGGVAAKTRETMLLCEAAGFDVVFVETVGVGQSETTVHSMVDFFLLLVLAGAGDELQGIKRGIIEMADAIAVTKADGANVVRAQAAHAEYRSALSLYPLPASGVRPTVLTASARTGEGLDAVWQAVVAYRARTVETGYFDRKRREQARHWMHQTIEQQLLERFFASEAVRNALPDVEAAVLAGRLSSFAAAQQLLACYRAERAAP
jgi:LAO/AO transport system kinase